MLMRRNVCWLRKNPDRFITLSADSVKLYSIDNVKPTLLADFPANFESHAKEDRLKCYDLCPVAEDLLALGYTSGRIILTKAGIDENIKTFQNVTDLTSDSFNAPICVEFNPLSQFHVLACLEGLVPEGSLLCVYEANRPKVNALVINAREDLSCATWFQDDWCLFAAGGRKSVKYYDIREGSRAVASTDIEAPVSALCTDHNKKTQFAAVIGDTMQIYDRRGLDYPIYKLRLSGFENRASDDIVLKWNPRRPFFVSCLRRGSSTLSEVLYPMGESNLRSERRGETMIEYQSAPFVKILTTQTSIESIPITGQEITVGGEGRRSFEANDAPKFHSEFIREFVNFSNISDFAYHPEAPSLVVLCSEEQKDDSSDIRIVKIKNFVTGDFSCHGNLAFATDNELCLYRLGNVFEDDISNTMQMRAKADYGTPLEYNISVEAYVVACREIAEKSAVTSEEVKWVWGWLSKFCHSEFAKPEVYGCFFPGVIRLMRVNYSADATPYGSTRTTFSNEYYGRVRIYKGGARAQILRLCGWPNLEETENRIREFLDSVYTKRDMPTRAIAIAMFLNQVDWAKEHLKKLLLLYREDNDGRRLELEKFVDAVFQYNGLPDPWLQISERLDSSIQDSYLRWVVVFLNNHCNGTNLSIFRLHGISVEDRVAFAAIHLSDLAFVESLNTALDEKYLGSSLQGLFICGLSRDIKSFRLLRRFVDQTGDVQTATLLYTVGHCYEELSSPTTPVSPRNVSAISDARFFSSSSMPERTDSAYLEALKDEEWMGLHVIEDYLDMLNTWGLFKKRARLNVFLQWYSIETAKTPDKEQGTSTAELCCQFCPCPIAATSVNSPEVTVSLSADTLVSPRTQRVSNLSTSSGSEPREQSCRQCGKPLPKCIICRRRMGTETVVECVQLKSLSAWFTWCQKCRHGGHMVHMLQWFRAHDECAASNCSCQCRLADADSITYEEPCQPDCLSCKNEGLVALLPNL